MTRGGWNIHRDERFAELVDKSVLRPGDTLSDSDAIDPATAIVSDDYGLVVDGVHYESPDLAAIAASGSEDVDGWAYWTLVRGHQRVATLGELRST